ncbi:Retrovirus-related Pol polyprotein from type-2 retrotransposable element R2DM [Chionoecetes opilio]|uniref:Retrovirus-related Pol polyprotein from type-2 retrotransposable element R2DM n=1 Tax=Chionoecetes opilio TaxID=41210 RepID=A0A8J4YVJ5_CHIOP|nr:Retrovirus-related Pol polyprotein from type-2 retrotransposable element R2DM [Chionoecetes opilio]
MIVSAQINTGGFTRGVTPSSRQHAVIRLTCAFLKKTVVKIYGKKISDSFQECDNYQLTSTVESLESNSDPDDEGLLLRGRRKRSKKNLPEDFVSSEDVHEKGHMMPVSQKTLVIASPEKVASAPSQVLFPKPPPKVSSNLLSIRTPGLTESGAAKRSRSSDYNRYVYAPTEMRKTEEKEMFYAKLDSVLDQCPPRDTLIVLGDFNTTNGTVRDGYELCVGPHGSGTRNTNSSLLLNFARSKRLRIAGSWYQRPELHHWTWYSNAGGVAKEIDHILVSTRWRILQNCRVYWSAEFFGTDHRLVVATLKLHVKSRRISRSNHTVFHLEKLKDLTCAHEYAVAVSNRFDVLGALGNPVELWVTFKRETLQAAKECIGERPRSRRGFVSTETLEKIEESCAARLAGNQDQHRALSRRTRTLLGRDKERYVRSLAEDVEGHLNANDLRPAYRALKKLRSKSPSRASAIRTADGRLVSDMDGQMARWAEYLGQLFTVDPPTEQLHTTGLQAVDADPPIDETAPSLDEVREAVAKLKGGKAAGVCNISSELLKAGGEAMIRGLHAVLTAVWQSGKVLAHLLLTRIRSHLVKHQRPQQSGFTPGKSTTDRILALCVLVERRRESRLGMLAAYVDLKKAFDSVHHESLWDLLRLRGIPARTIGLITGLYSGTESAVKCGAGVSSFFPVNTGVRQGCVLAPSLFNACMDWVLDKVVDQSDCGASVGNTRITDLVFADDAVIFAESLEVLVMALEALHDRG